MTSTQHDRGATAKSLYDHLAVAVSTDPWLQRDPEPQPEPAPLPPGTIYTAQIETIDNDQAFARLGGLPPL